MASDGEIQALADWIAARERLIVLTGAGCSTESGIPDYRDEAGAWKRTPPMTYQEFLGTPAARRRYWARSARGWHRMRDVEPGAAHRALARLEAAGRVDALITQNVDRLHQRAGSRRVIDLHGRIDQVVCLDCSARMGREQLQIELDVRNPGWSGLQADARPDGDAAIDDVECAGFRFADCPACGGTLKPDVVFFGEAVPAGVVANAYRLVEEADGLLVAGSSLMVYSGYRFVRAALERGLPIALVNRGRTRADSQVILKIQSGCGEVLEAVTARVLGFAAREPCETARTVDTEPSSTN